MKIICVMLWTSTSAHGPVIGNSPGTTPEVTFTENKGQVSDQHYRPRPDVRFYGEQGPISFHITDKGISYQFSEPFSWRRKGSEYGPDATGKVADSLRIHRVDVRWIAANDANSGFEGTLPVAGHENFYTASCPDGLNGVLSYQRVVKHNLYPGIDLEYHSSNGRVKYDLLVAEGTDATIIRMEVCGAQASVAEDGSLVLKCPLGEIIEDPPLVLQNGKVLKARWKVQGNEVSYAIERKDPDAPMVIDPALRVWSTYYGGSARDSIEDVMSDHVGHIYVCGATNSTNLIATTGAHQTTKSVGTDATLAKFSGDGARLWGTYLGGTGTDFACAIGFDPMAGAVYLSGRTTSFTSIATAGSHQTGPNGGEDGFLIRFNGNGDRIWGTYYGGEMDDVILDLALDDVGNVLICGQTSSQIEGSIASLGCHQPSYGGGLSDAFIAKISSDGVRIWGSYFGGTGGSGYSEGANGIACSSDGTVALSGNTQTTDPGAIATSGAYQTTFSGGSAFLAVFNPDGVRQWGTFYGTSYSRAGWHGCAWQGPSILMTGQAPSTVNPDLLTAGFPAALAEADIFLVRFDGTGQRIWSRWCGGPALSCYSNGLAVDGVGSIYLAGHFNNGSPGAPGIGTPGSFQELPTTSRPAFVARYDAEGQRTWGSYFDGNSGTMVAAGVCVDPFGSVYMAGFSSASDLGTSGTHQSTYSGDYDGFLVKFCSPVVIESLLIDDPQYCDELGLATAQATGGTTGLQYTWLGDLSASGNTALYDPGTEGSVIVTSPTGVCASSDTAEVLIPAVPGLEYTTAVTDVLCAGDSSGGIDLTITQGTPPYHFDWTGNVDSEDLSGVPAGDYDLYVTDDHNCVAELEFVISEPLPLSASIVSTSGPFCLGLPTGSIDLDASGGVPGYAYVWSDGSTVQDLSGIPAGTYVATITDANDCSTTAEVTLNEPDDLVITGVITDESAGNDGAIDITVSGGTPEYLYLWSNDSTIEDLIGLVGGVYTVHVTDANGCMDSLQAEVGSSVGFDLMRSGEQDRVMFDAGANQLILTSASNPSSVDLFDDTGRTVLSRRYSGSPVVIPVPDVRTGIYLVRWRTAVGFRSQRILINNP